MDMAKTIKGVSISTVSDFLSRIGSTSIGERRLFRGQNTDKPLHPRIVRIAINKAMSLKDMKNNEQKMLSRFRQESALIIERIKEPTDLELLSISQHYGMPTRLLDWTANALAGLWFAVSTNPPNNKDNGVVWMMISPNEKTFDSTDDIFNLGETYFFQPTHLDRRISAQSAWFSIHRYKYRGEKKDWYLPLEKHEKYEKRLNKFIVPVESFDTLRQELRLLGISHASMYPDLWGLSSDIEAEFRIA